MTESQLFDGEHCPRCGAEIETDETDTWETVLRCSEADHWFRVSDYKGTPERQQ